MTRISPVPKVFGVLVTYRRPNDLSLMLKRLADQDVPLAKLVVVDNHPSPETVDIVRRNADGRSVVEYLAASENLGPAGGIALGMEAILPHAGDEDWIILLDDDDPPPDSVVLRQLRDFGRSMLQSDPRTAGVGLSGARFNQRAGRLVRPHADELRGAVAVDYIGGNQLPCYLARAVRDVGVFTTCLFWGFDDLEYGLRLHRAGYALYVPGSVWRDRRRLQGRMGMGGRPSMRVGEVTWRRYYSLRNLIYILRSIGAVATAVRVTLVHGLAKPAVNMPIDPKKAWSNAKMNLRACIDAWTGRMGRTLDPPS
jgi:glycosyltransferase involved in cell wall biosynthesis